VMSFFPRPPQNFFGTIVMGIRSILWRKGQRIRRNATFLENLGYRFQRNFAFMEPTSDHETIQPLFSLKPSLAMGTFVAPTASIVGDVEIGGQSAVWYGATLRGDLSQVRVGENTVIGEHSVITGKTQVGNRVYIGGKTVLQDCIIHNNVRIGEFSSIHEGSVIEDGAILLENTRVYQGVVIPSGQVWGGSPAEFIRNVTDADRMAFAQVLTNELKRARTHAEEFAKNTDLSRLARTSQEQPPQIQS